MSRRPALDKIVIRDIALKCIIGVYPEERREKQDVVITVALHCDLGRACRTDDVADTVDYMAVEKAIVGLVESSEFALIEALAQAVADACLRFDRVEQVDVTVEKPRALEHARTVAVEISRRKQVLSSEC
jgi:D-erythro-7,8-dihydroneopterin triphosphate epimerase